MALNDDQLYGISYSLAEIAKDEYGENAFISFSKILNICKTNHFAQLLLTRVSTPAEKVKLIFMAYLIITKRYKKESIIGLSLSLYLYIIDFYDSSEEIKKECNNCYGTGEEECGRCDGTGNEDCKYCDGDGKVECYECDGEGTEECRYCDGKGTETDTEEDDEGEEIEVEVPCTSCDGSGKEYCRNCGGDGDFECSECDGRGNNNCDDCGGYGEYTCGYCDGYGEEDSGEYRYGITRATYITVGDELSDHMAAPMYLEDFEEIDADDEKIPYSFTVSKKYYLDDDNKTKEERQNDVGLDDDFVEILEAYKLENYPYDIKF